jgi:hypothetical protein
MYSKIFKSIFDGSLYGNFDATVTFMAMIVLAERGGVVDMTAIAIAAKCGYPIEVIQRGLAHLELPDAESRTPDDDGRRILRIDVHRTWGWRITNYDAYHAMRSAEERREYFRVHKAAKRAADKQMSTLVTNVHDVTPSDSYSDSDSDVDKDIKPKSKNLDRHSASAEVPPEFLTMQAIYPRRSGGQRWPDARKSINARLREGSTWQQILDGTQRYLDFCRATGKERTEHVQQAATFVGENKGFDEPWDLPLNKAEVKVDQNISTSIDWLHQQEAKRARN